MKVMWSMLFVLAATIAFGDTTRIPQPLPKGTPEPPLSEIKEGYYKIKTKNYTSMALIKRIADSDGVYLVFQYTGSDVSKGVGFVQNDTLIFNWETGVMAVKFKNGAGRSTWVSNPGNKQINHETWTYAVSFDNDD